MDRGFFAEKRRTFGLRFGWNDKKADTAAKIVALTFDSISQASMFSFLNFLAQH